MKSVFTDEISSRSGNRLRNIPVDSILLQQVEEIFDGSNTHRAANLIDTYKASINYYNLTGDPALLKTACETECELRSLLTRSRLMRALDILHARHADAFPGTLESRIGRLP